MLAAAVHHGSRQPPPADDGPVAGGTTIKATVAELRTDLERHRHCVVEIEGLIAKLENYANGEGASIKPDNIKLAPSARPVTGNGRRRQDGTPEQIAYRQRKARNMQERRAKLKATTTVTPPPPSAKPKPRQPKRKPGAPAAVSNEQPKAPPAPPKAAVSVIIEETMATVPPSKRNPRGRPIFTDGYRQPPSSMTTWEIDEKRGIRSRQRITSGGLGNDHG
jgi:hypothetical protein